MGADMVFLSVLLVSISLSLSLTECRSRLSDDLDNEVGQPESSSQNEWIKMSLQPMPTIRKKVFDHVELVCGAMGSPPPTLQWYKRAQRLTETDTFQRFSQTTGLAEVNSRLVINHLLPRHQDIYTCVAQSGNEIATGASKLIIVNKEGREMNFTQLLSSKILGAHHLPRVTFWASTFMDVIGNDVVLPCNFVGNPKPNLTWMGPNKKLIENDEKYSIFPDGELRIRSINWSDMGEYTCVVENTVGVDSVGTFLYPMKESSK